MSPLISPVVLTFNEAPNLERTLVALSWAREVVVLDSGSTDDTLAIARSFHNVRIVEQPFEDFASQFAAGAAACHTDWVLALDADHVVSRDLAAELQRWQPVAGIHAYLGPFRYCIEGRELRASLYPARIVLFDRTRCHFTQDGHHQVLQHSGDVGWLRGPIFHDDRKPLARWLSDQDRYARMEAQKLSTVPAAALTWPDRCRCLIVIAPALVFLGTLFAKGVILDGWHGWFYACQRTVAELILSLRLVEARFADRGRR